MALTHRGFWNLASVLVLGGAFVGFGGGKAFAQATMGPSGVVTSPMLDFRRYCAQCHGMSGIGDGPVASALKKKPANLTLLSANNGGVFPEQEVRNFIDGTKTSAAHGSRAMPIWGDAFRMRTGAASGAGGIMGAGLTQPQVDAKIDSLVGYIKSIQRCAAPTTFSGLPSAPTKGFTCDLTDAPSCSSGTPVTAGGGSTACQVSFNGTNWMPAQ
jgi:mono/diheme cytochrome c family protein